MAAVPCEIVADTNLRDTYLEIAKKQQQQKNFSALTPEDVSVELVAVYSFSLDDCWKPDGSKLDEKLFVKDERPLQKKNQYGFILKIKGPDDINFKARHVAGAVRWDSSTNVTDSKGQRLDDFQSVNASIENGRSYTSLRVAIAARPWKNAAQFDAQKQTPQTAGDITLSSIRQDSDHLSIFIADKSLGHSEHRIVATDKDGNTHKGYIDDSVPNMRPNSIIVKFPDLKLAQIDRLQLQKRPFRTIQFSDISIRPNVTRNVEIHVETFADEKPPAAQEKTKTAHCLLEHVESTTKVIGGRTVKHQILDVPFPEGTRLVLQNNNGSIKVKGWDKNDCRVTADIEVGLQDNQKTEELLQKISIQPELSYKKIDVGITLPEKAQQQNAPNVDFQIMVPKTADLELNTRTGAVTLADVTGEMECKTNDGVILAQKINGNVRLRNNYGKILINNSSFDNAVIRGNTADVTCEDISGNINVRVAAGQVKVQYAKTAPEICNVAIVTTDGNIDFTGPANFSAEVQARTMKGEIQTDLPLKIKGKRRKTASGTLGSGDGKLNLKAVIGSIKIHKNIPQNKTWRAIHLTGPSHQNLETTKKLITNVLAPMQINVLILEVNYSFRFTSHPELAAENGLTSDDARQLTELSRKHGIRLIPLFNCLGHQSWAKNTFPLLTKYPQFDETPHIPKDNPDIYCREWCPLHPEVNKIVFDLMDELIDAFDADAFHVGMDEVFLIGDQKCPRCKGKDVADLFAKAVNDYHKHLVTGRKVEMLLWGDRLLDTDVTGYGTWEASKTGSHRAVDLIPEDIIICDWHYELMEDYPSVRFFQQKGFRVLPATWRNPDAALALLRCARKDATDKMLGFLFTNWSGARGQNQLLAALKDSKDSEQIPEISDTTKGIAEAMKLCLEELKKTPQKH